MGVGKAIPLPPCNANLSIIPGMLRLKKHKEKGSRRALLRNSSTGKITIVRTLSDVKSFSR
jgi:hypothetical protein